MSKEEKKEKLRSLEMEIDQNHDDPQENLVGFFSILFDVAKRTNPEKYLSDNKNEND